MFKCNKMEQYFCYWQNTNCDMKFQTGLRNIFFQELGENKLFLIFFSLKMYLGCSVVKLLQETNSQPLFRYRLTVLEIQQQLSLLVKNKFLGKIQQTFLLLLFLNISSFTLRMCPRSQGSSQVGSYS